MGGLVVLYLRQHSVTAVLYGFTVSFWFSPFCPLVCTDCKWRTRNRGKTEIALGKPIREFDPRKRRLVRVLWKWLWSGPDGPRVKCRQEFSPPESTGHRRSWWSAREGGGLACVWLCPRSAEQKWRSWLLPRRPGKSPVWPGILKEQIRFQL